MTYVQPSIAVVVGHGVDLVANARIEKMLSEHGERFIGRVFTDQERAYCEQGDKRRVERYAVRFAAKEAALKAIGTGWRSGIAWADVEVVSEPSGRPRLAVRGRCREIAASMGIDAWLVSLSHVEAYSIASVIAGKHHMAD